MATRCGPSAARRSLVAEAGVERYLQEAGETALNLLEHDRDAGTQPAIALAALLTARAWTGDAELAELLLALAADRPSERRRIRADRYVFIPNEGSRDAWEDMRDFAVAVQDEAVREQLLDAIDGRGAFSRLRRIPDRHDGRPAHRWHA